MIRGTVIPWQDGDSADADVIVEVRNISTSSIDVAADFQDFAIDVRQGEPFATGSLTGLFPYEIAPGAIGYLTANVMTIGTVDASTAFRLTTTTKFVKATTRDIVVMVAGATNKPLSGANTGASTSGTVTNTSRIVVEEVAVGAFYYDGSGNLLGYSQGGPSNLGPGKTKPFVTAINSPPLDFAAIQRTVVIAESFCRSGPCLP